MRLLYGWLLLLSQVLAAAIDNEKASDLPEPFFIVIPNVPRVSDWERARRMACEDLSQEVSKHPIQDESKDAPKVFGNFDHKGSRSHKQSPDSEEHHTRSDQAFTRTTHASAEPYTRQHQAIAHEIEVPARARSCSSEECAEHDTKNTGSKRDTDKTEPSYDQHHDPADQHQVTQPHPGTHQDEAESEGGNLLKSFWQNFDLSPNKAELESGNLVKSFWQKFNVPLIKARFEGSDLLEFLQQNFDLPPVDPRLWTLKHYATVIGSLGSSILVSLGLVSTSKRWFRQSVTKENDSPMLKQHEDGPPENTPDNDSSSEKQNTPTSSDEQNSSDDSPSPALERDTVYHTSGPRNEQNFTDRPPEPADQSSKHKTSQDHDHDTSTRTSHHSTSEHVSVSDESSEQGENSGYVLIDKDHTIRDHSTSYTTERHSETHESRSNRDTEPATPFKQSDLVPAKPLSFGTHDRRHGDEQANLAGEYRERSTLQSGKTNKPSHESSEEASRDLGDDAGKTRPKLPTSASSEGSGLDHWVDISDTKAPSVSMNDVDGETARRHEGHDITLRVPGAQPSQSTDIVHGVRDTYGSNHTIVPHPTSSGVRPSHGDFHHDAEEDHPTTIAAVLEQQVADTSKGPRSRTTRRVAFEDGTNQSSHDEGLRSDKNAAVSEGRTGAHDTVDEQETQSIDSSTVSDLALLPESLDSILARHRATRLSDDLSAREARRGETSLTARSRAERATSSPVWSPSSRRSPSAPWTQNRWSSPTGRRDTARPQHFSDSCAICRRNAQLKADAAKAESTSRTSPKMTAVTTTSAPRQQVRIYSRPTSPVFSRPTSPVYSRPGSPMSPLEEAERQKRLSFRRTLSQVLSPSQSKPTFSLSSGSSSVPDRAKGKAPRSR